MTVFVDTSAVYALVAAHDDQHVAAHVAFQELLEDDVLVTHNYVAAESISLVHARRGVAPLPRLREILDVLEHVWVEDDVHAVALERLVAGSRRGPSFVDCVSFEVMERAGIDIAFAFDDHFAAAGFRLVGTDPPATRR